MRIACIIWIICLSFLIPGYLEGNDTVPVIPFETEQASPVELDSLTLKSFQKNGQYDYYSFHPKGESLWNRLRMALLRWLAENVDPDITLGDADTVFGVITGIVIVVLLLLLFIFKPSIFYLSRRKKTDYKIEEESIKEAGFEKFIQDALAAGNYSEAIRWRYLSVLKAMQEKELISWHANKTVNEYIRELKQPDLQPDFRSLSKLFLHIRYGNFEAEEMHYREAETLSVRLIKKI